MAGCSNQYIREALELARELIILADSGEAEVQDDGCAVLFGVIRDCAYKIRTQAEREREKHKVLGLWNSENGNALSGAYSQAAGKG